MNYLSGMFFKLPCMFEPAGKAGMASAALQEVGWQAKCKQGCPDYVMNLIYLQLLIYCVIFTRTGRKSGEKRGSVNHYLDQKANSKPLLVSWSPDLNVECRGTQILPEYLSFLPALEKNIYPTTKHSKAKKWRNGFSKKSFLALKRSSTVRSSVGKTHARILTSESVHYLSVQTQAKELLQDRRAGAPAQEVNTETSLEMNILALIKTIKDAVTRYLEDIHQHVGLTLLCMTSC